jgi:hypothetical protein
MVGYLQAFRDMVSKAHRDQDKRCHWNWRDELIDAISGANPVKGGIGLCDCPRHKGTKDPCSPHQCHSCASTKDVLETKTAADKDYQDELKKLEQADADMAEALEKGEEQLKSGLDDGETLEEALKRVTVLGSGGHHWGDNSKARKAVLTIAGLDLKHHPTKDELDAGCDCECFKAKEWRLKSERQKIEDLISEADKMNSQIKKLVDDLTATLWNTAVPVLKGAIKTVAGILSGDAGKATEGAKELFEYYQTTTEESQKVFMLLRATKALSDMKRFAMIGVIYFDQQAKAPTCHPLGDEEPPFPPPNKGKITPPPQPGEKRKQKG